MENLRFEETPTSPKDIRPGNYIKVEVNGQMRSAQVVDTSSVKNGKHGAAKTTIASKILCTGSNHKGIYTANDSIIVCRPEKVQLKLIDISGSTITFSDSNGSFDSVDVSGKMSSEDISKIAQSVEGSSSESFDLSLRVLPDFYKLESIRKSGGPSGSTAGG
ncbi:translation initiation factor 5A-like protein [Encephalitozoon intestinalis ATCC 50506]|uniref:Translation initiation factor 5A-like protein n=1 Tax=Encephalitozoon intestinalis (strain ATCC 50506) TaxID=876142 RepID=E0S8Z6_ENCIT|nr:translation initiation factor 5A-like protein [Encephalitozoon intestinalis ATCC 50506]ADM12262.1 translation initiation factor 5A-like protein [Encephalitozoon intestinalis ATCC 50506]UTX46069.1 elongation factor P [Encephalitozoon intestinalis]